MVNGTMIVFNDFYDNEVHLSFDDHPFSLDPKHVWVISRYKNQWLLTEHPRRGIEFPGGKVEEGETPEAAAVREVYEETGGVVSTIKYVGQYEVLGKGGTIVKNIYFAMINHLKKHGYFETNGPVLMNSLPAHIKQLGQFSFMMKDDVLTESLKKLDKLLN